DGPRIAILHQPGGFMNIRWILIVSLTLLNAACGKMSNTGLPQTGTNQESTGIDDDSNTTTSNGDQSEVETPVQPTNYKAELLAWESSSHPERADWSKSAIQWVSENFTTLDRANDIEIFCPTYDRLSRDQRINVWADVFAATAYYECGWNPKSY